MGLHELCSRYKGKIQQETEKEQGREYQVCVEELSIVLFECRNLERYILRKDVALRKQEEKEGPMAYGISAEEKERVDSVLKEFDADNLPNYW